MRNQQKKPFSAIPSPLSNIMLRPYGMLESVPTLKYNEIEKTRRITRYKKVAGINESVRSGGVRPNTHFPKVVDGCYSYSQRRCRSGLKKCVAIPRISCEMCTNFV